MKPLPPDLRIITDGAPDLFDQALHLIAFAHKAIDSTEILPLYNPGHASTVFSAFAKQGAAAKAFPHPTPLVHGWTPGNPVTMTIHGDGASLALNLHTIETKTTLHPYRPIRGQEAAQAHNALEHIAAILRLARDPARHLTQAESAKITDRLDGICAAISEDWQRVTPGRSFRAYAPGHAGGLSVRVNRGGQMSRDILTKAERMLWGRDLVPATRIMLQTIANQPPLLIIIPAARRSTALQSISPIERFRLLASLPQPAA